MTVNKFGILATAVALSSAALWSCNKNKSDATAKPGSSEQAPPRAPPDSSVQPADSEQSTAMAQLHAGCPMAVEGVGVAVSETDGGIALTFTTEEGDVDDLRTRVQHMAQMYEMQGGHRSMMWRHMHMEGARGGAGAAGPPAGMGPMPAVHATVTEIDEGARLELTPSDPSQLDALREHVKRHQQRMQSGECWMLQDQSSAPGGE